MESEDKIGKIASGATLMAVAFFISRILGLVREQAIAWRYGATSVTDLYNASFLIPDFLFHLLAGGVFSIVLIPMLAKHVTEEESPRLGEAGVRIFSRVFFPLAVMITLLTLLLLLLAPPLSWLLFPAFRGNPHHFALLVKLTRIIIPAQVFFLLGGLYNSVNRACGDFRATAWSPNIYNLGIIAGALFLGPLLGIAGLSVGALSGAFAGAFLICYWMSLKRMRQRLSFRFFSAEFKEYIWLSLPLMVGFSMLSIDQWFVRFFGARSGVSSGTITCLNYARTIMLIPIGLIGQAVGQVSLTYLSQLWGQGKKREFTTTFSQTLTGMIFLTIAFSGFIHLAARPLISLLFQHGAFTPANTLATASFLGILVFAVPPFAAQQTLVNGYYSRKNTLRPAIISTAASILSFFIYWFMQKRWSGTGIALAAVICFWLLFLVTLRDYWRTFGRSEGFTLKPLALAGLRAFAMSAAAYLACIALFRWLHLEGGVERIGSGFARSLHLASPHLRQVLVDALSVAALGSAFFGLLTTLALASRGPEAHFVRRLWGLLARRRA